MKCSACNFEGEFNDVELKFEVKDPDDEYCDMPHEQEVDVQTREPDAKPYQRNWTTLKACPKCGTVKVNI